MTFRRWIIGSEDHLTFSFFTTAMAARLHRRRYLGWPTCWPPQSFLLAEFPMQPREARTSGEKVIYNFIESPISASVKGFTNLAAMP